MKLQYSKIHPLWLFFSSHRRWSHCENRRSGWVSSVQIKYLDVTLWSVIMAELASFCPNCFRLWWRPTVPLPYIITTILQAMASSHTCFWFLWKEMTLHQQEAAVCINHSNGEVGRARAQTPGQHITKTVWIFVTFMWSKPSGAWFRKKKRGGKTVKGD